jgi:hypothetical protein
MKARNMQWMIGIVTSAILTGCATAPAGIVPAGIVPAGQNAYHVRVVGARYETQSDTNFKALKVASVYCDLMAKHVMFRQSTETREHAWSPKQEDLTFVCMDARDPAYMRAAVERAPPVVAQQ